VTFYLVAGFFQLAFPGDAAIFFQGGVFPRRALIAQRFPFPNSDRNRFRWPSPSLYLPHFLIDRAFTAANPGMFYRAGFQP
jgi:hypothetical protein